MNIGKKVITSACSLPSLSAIVVQAQSVLVAA
jgi:hypothetical protein